MSHCNVAGRKEIESHNMVLLAVTNDNLRGLRRTTPDSASDIASDAWATGQAIFALAEAGLKSDAPAIARARQFLIGSQRGRLLAHGVATYQTRWRRLKESYPDYRRRQRLGSRRFGAQRVTKALRFLSPEFGELGF